MYDVAPVNRPAYPAATVGLRSLAASKHAPIEDVEALAKNGELSKLFKVTTKQPVRMTGVEAILSILDIA